MSSPMKTTITRVELTEEESSDESTGSESEAEEYHVSEDNRYESTTDVVSVEALNMIKELYIKNNFNKLSIIQMKIKDDMKSTKVCHSVLLDTKPKPNDKTTDQFTDSQNVYEFKNKEKLIKELETKLKEKVISGQKNVKKAKKITKSDIQMNIIPKTFDDFLQIILELNPLLIEDQNSKLFFREETNNREIRFRSHESYVRAFNPFIIREFWTHLKNERKRDINSYEMTYERISDKEMVCTHIRDKTYTQSVFKYSQIVVLKYLQNEVNLESNESESKVVFGIVREVKTKLIDKTSNHLSNPLIKSQTQTESQENEEMFIIEELIIVCNPLDQIYDSVSVMPLTCVQKYLLEARIVSELKEDKFSKIFGQILKPNFKLGITGFSVNLENRENLFDIQKDCIQKAYDVCFYPEMPDCSSIVSINGGPKTGKTESLKETVLQLLKLAENKIQKLIVISKGSQELTQIIDFLKKHEIKVYHIDSEGKCLSHKNSDLKRAIRKMNKNLMFEEIDGKIDCFEKIMKFYSEDMELKDLSVKERYVKEKMDLEVICKLMTESQVIIGSITDVMNDVLFNSIYNCNQNNEIIGALVDNAHLFTETEILTLLYSGVKGLVLYGDSLKNPISYEMCESFFQRYIRLFNQNYRQIDAKTYSVIHIRDTIASMQRYNKNRNNSSSHFRNDNNYRERRKNPNQRLNEYRRNSNYGSEFFNKNNRFKDNKPFKSETKDEMKPFPVINSQSNREMYEKPEHQRGGFGYRPSRGGYGPRPPRGGRGGPRAPNPHNSSNLMTDGLVSQMAFGNRDAYYGRNTHQNDYNYTSIDSNSNGMSGFGADIDIQSNSQNNSPFVPNPRNHQNYNLF